VLEPTNLTDIQEFGATRPREAQSSRLYLVTLWNVIDDPATHDIISWDLEDVKTFKIHDIEKFKEEVLPKHYTAKWNSFRRQLYFYGWKGQRDAIWTHADMNHTMPESLHNIKRVKANRKRKAADMMFAAMQSNPMYAAMYQAMMGQSMNMMGVGPMGFANSGSSSPPFGLPYGQPTQMGMPAGMGMPMPASMQIA